MKSKVFSIDTPRGRYEFVANRRSYAETHVDHFITEPGFKRDYFGLRVLSMTNDQAHNLRDSLKFERWIDEGAEVKKLKPFIYSDQFDAVRELFDQFDQIPESTDTPDTPEWFRIWYRPNRTEFMDGVTRTYPVPAGFVVHVDISNNQYTGLRVHVTVQPDGFWSDVITGNISKSVFASLGDFETSLRNSSGAGAVKSDDTKFPPTVGIKSDLERARNFAAGYAYAADLLEQIETTLEGIS